MRRAACKIVREGSEYVRVELQKRREARNKRRELPRSTTCVGSHAPCFRSAVKVASVATVWRGPVLRPHHHRDLSFGSPATASCRRSFLDSISETELRV